MKLTSQNQRADSSGLHNDRNFDLDDALHIDREKTCENKYWTYTGNKDTPLAELELQFYRDHFQPYISQQNAKNSREGHKGRNRTLKQYFSSKQTRPEDKIIQIGDRNEHPEPEKLWEICLEYQKRFNEAYGANCKILDMSLHVDETQGTPHVHIRRVWIHTDENGFEKVGQGRALDELGVMAGDTSQREDRQNNAKVTFTAQERQLIRDICLEKGVDLEPDEPTSRKHLNVPEYKNLMDEKHELERQTQSLRKELDEFKEESEEIRNLCEQLDKFLTAPSFYNIHDMEVAEAKKKNLAKRAAELIKIFKEEAGKVTASEGSFRAMAEQAYRVSQDNKLQKEINTLNHKVEILNSFVISKGLGEELLKSITHKERNTNSPHRNLL